MSAPTAENLLDMPGMADFPISPAHGISAVALNFALKWCDVTIIKDGVMYQQQKMEGRNIQPICLDDVLHVAKQFEAHILAAPGRLSGMIFEVLEDALEQITDESEPAPEADEPA